MAAGEARDRHHAYSRRALIKVNVEKRKVQHATWLLCLQVERSDSPQFL